VSLNIRDCKLTAGFHAPLSGFNERSTKLASKLLSGGQTGKAPAYITAAIFMFPLRRPSAYALASMEIMHGWLAPDVGRNLDYVREV
jgi:hypothetical protein